MILMHKRNSKKRNTKINFLRDQIFPPQKKIFFHPLIDFSRVLLESFSTFGNLFFVNKLTASKKFKVSFPEITKSATENFLRKEGPKKAFCNF